MKTKETLLIAIVGLLFGVGCASERGGSIADAGTICTDSSCAYPVPPRSYETDYGTYSGSTTKLQAAGSALAKMFYNSNPNNPTDIRINIDLRREAESVIISYVENGRVYEAAFGVVHPYSGHKDKSYNKWYVQGGKAVWKGFFQDAYGAIVLVIDQNISQGDGRPPEVVGGSVWFQNFNRYYPSFWLQGPLKMCWEIQMGPYDCRSFLNNGRVSMTSTLYPENKGPDAGMYYELLGTFSGIIASEAGLN